MKNNKGQALVEFVLVVPIFLIIVFSMIDFGIILHAKLTLENKTNDVRELIKEDKSVFEIERFINKDKQYKISLAIDEEGEETSIVMITDIKVITPGLNKVFSNPFPVEVTRIIKNE